MPTREKGFAICLENRGAEDLDIGKVYGVLSNFGTQPQVGRTCRGCYQR